MIICVDVTKSKISQLNTKGLKKFKHNTKTGLFELTKNGCITMEIVKKNRLIIISPDGSEIILEDRSKQNKQRFYKFEKLPSKLIPFYEYASQLIQVLRQRQNKIRI